MVSHTPSSSDRPSNSRSGSGGNGRAERTPGTPRKDGGAGKDKAVQEPGLKDYRLGECLGKGAFGSVYKAFNWGTGEAVAVKQIKLGDLPKSELRMIEAEIDLLKNLNHDNIVKYLGYCENGSLHSICKSYGKFPENLVGVYMGQILLGLQYLHDQGVIHRDIKGANILTTKDGKVKLADFGVSTSTLAGADKEAQVVGTPYWMAPEIIQLSGATPASDIWSLGCTVIELLEGKPPYHKLAPMPALFAIVNDDHPPLPEGVSPAARDFLMQCFQKDPNLRVSARKLLKHAWIVGSRRTDAPIAKPPTNFSEAVEEVKQWNEALRSPTGPGSFRTSIKSNMTSPIPARRDPPLRNVHNDQQGTALITPAKGPLSIAKPKHSAEAFRSPESIGDDNWDDDFTSSISPSALHLPQFKPHDNFGGLLSADRLKAFASFDMQNEDSDNWDSNFKGDLSTLRGPHRSIEVDTHELETIRPYRVKPTVVTQDIKPPTTSKHGSRKTSVSAPPRPKSPIKVQADEKLVLPIRPGAIYREQSVEDYSDIFMENDSIFDRRLSIIKDDALSPKLFHPSDLTSLPRSAQSPVTNVHGSMRRKPISRREDPSMRRTRSSVEIQRYAEDEDDEDFSDIFGKDDATVERYESDRGSEDGVGALMLHSKLSNNSWLGDEDDEDDPFASLEQGFDEMDLQANIARDKHARLCTMVEGLVSSLKVTEDPDTLSDLSEQLLDILFESEDAKGLIISAHGMLPILEILEPCTVKSRQSMILRLLKVVNTIILNDVEIQENLCFVGGIPIITKFAARQYSTEIRLEAAAFVRQMYQTSTLTLQMFVSAGGLNVLVEFLDEDYDEAKDLVLIGVNGIWNVFELQGPTPKNDFCRIFSRSKILSPLALVLDRVLDEEDELSELVEGRIVNIFYLFSQAENYVKEVVADRVVLKRVLKDLRRMSPSHQITMLKFIKNLSMLSTTLDSLHAANAIELLIDLLSSSMKKASGYFREISNQVLNTMFNLCRLSKARQEDAAINGIIPLLLKTMKTDRPPKEFALPILCDMAHSGKLGRKYLWQNKGLQFYVSLLDDQYWQVTALDAIFIWLQEETAKVEKSLLEGDFIEAIVQCFNAPRASAFDYNLLEPLQKLLRLSSPVAASLARADLYSGILQKLNHKKAVVRLNLLRIVRSICDLSDEQSGSIRDHKLFEAIEHLAENDSAVLVRNMANDLVRSSLEKERESGSGGRSRPVGAVRRKNSFTPPLLQHSASTPMTPTHGSRISQSPAFMNGSLTPRRIAATSYSNGDSILYRPRSRDGATPQIPRRVSGEHAANGTSSVSKSRLPRTSMLRSSRASLAAPLPRDEPTFPKRENGVKLRERTRSTASNSPAPGGTAPQLNSKRRGRVPSGDIKWS
ncbi:Cell division control protein-like protein 15 [Venustampulla echinocandica]|uniref:non-specific serine/threonine protein kinase n=1 Tax=Venustampulla echinocandica TaxID=2656787 RepID=A0A370TRA1_9HELO|nr:Cell division control protein-like protein 15 [Venustampulla echinocandica]RDL38065.1 Cell division control protein-like protein 15 [Venustampulla echinocandica]